MTNQCLAPPPTVKNMTVLDRSAFTKVVSVPSVSINKKHFVNIMKKLKPYVLRLLKFNSVLTPSGNSDLRQILLNPELITSENELKLKLGEEF
ncbi:hypothetical protein Avbf_02176 [Armadillidium vulgare]|nr:hypothetical protein Avbf_02176 [Armadillidium vulgare]